MTKNTIAETYIDKLRSLKNDDRLKAEQTLLISNYLRLLPADEEAYFNKLIAMARNSTLSHENIESLA